MQHAPWAVRTEGAGLAKTGWFPPLRRGVRAALALCMTAMVGAGCARSNTDASRFVYREIRMGVEARLVIHAPHETAARAAARAAFARIGELEAVLSDYRPDSELMRLNAVAGGPPIVVSDDLYRVLERGRSLAEATDGAFDMTVGPVVRLWRETRRDGVLPPPESIVRARALVNWRAVELDPDRRTARLARAGMQLDAGGIGKGFAADEALQILRRHRLDRCLVDFSGDIVAGAPPPGRRTWRVHVGEGVAAIDLVDGAVATSGAAYQYVEIDGVRYAHIVDPRTGLGVTSGVTATVHAPDGATADAVASAAAVGWREPIPGVKIITVP